LLHHYSRKAALAGSSISQQNFSVIPVHAAEKNLGLRIGKLFDRMTAGRELGCPSPCPEGYTM
jgi:hypothetical protein